MTAEYFEWMCHLVCDHQRGRRRSWRKLLRYLHQREFVWLLDMDENRATDGIDLRYRFAYETHHDKADMLRELEKEPCSVLEMMIALAIRCEEHIMDDPDIGNRTGEWFWEMIKNLGLDQMHDSTYDQFHVEECVDRFLNRAYKPNGEGGLFKVRGGRWDMRYAEIWYQMMWHLDEYLAK